MKQVLQSGSLYLMALEREVEKKDETIKDAAQHETVEYEMQPSANWDHDYFENDAGNTAMKGHMFPLFVSELVPLPEKEIHERTWMDVRNARKLHRKGWMKEAMELSVSCLTSQSKRTQGEIFPGIGCSCSGRATILPLDVELKRALTPLLDRN